jgi:hypothetical protein
MRLWVLAVAVNSGVRKCCASAFCAMAPNICGRSVRKLVHVTLVPVRNSRWHKGDMNQVPCCRKPRCWRVISEIYSRAVACCFRRFIRSACASVGLQPQRAKTHYRSEDYLLICVYELIQRTDGRVSSLYSTSTQTKVWCVLENWNISLTHVHSTEFQSFQRRTKNITAVVCFRERGQLIYGYAGRRTVYNLSNPNYGLAFGMTFKTVAEGRGHCTAICKNKSTRQYWSPTNIRRHRTTFAHPWINGDSENSQSHHEMCTSQHTHRFLALARLLQFRTNASWRNEQHNFPIGPLTCFPLHQLNGTKRIMQLITSKYHDVMWLISRSSHVMSRRYDSRCQWHSLYNKSHSNTCIYKGRCEVPVHNMKPYAATGV